MKNSNGRRKTRYPHGNDAAARRPQPEQCHQCRNGCGYTLVWRHEAGRYVAVECNRCSGDGVEPTTSLRELRRLNQQRIATERNG